MNNLAFEYLRQFKKVSEDTEELVMKLLKRRYPDIGMNELVQIFEQGIAGDFGKVYAADPETILDWVKESMKRKGRQSSYYEAPILSPHVSIIDLDYPQKMEDWQKEVNKAFTAFLNGVSTRDMHPHLYDRLMVDGKIPMNSYHKYLDNSVDESKQRFLADYFTDCKNRAYTYIYFIKA